MSKYKMISPAVPNVPWQDKPENHEGAPLWRYTENPVIGRNPVEGVARIFNSAVIPYEGKFGRSEDGLHWTFDKEKINFVNEKGESFMPKYAYDPRLVKVEDTYYVIWCQDFYGASIGVAKTTDFKTFTRIENPFIPFNRNAVLFPRKINGNYVMLSRPSDSGHTPFGDIFLSESPDMTFWGKHRHVMGKTSEWWESVKIGGGAAILDIDEPSRVKYRCENFLLTPETWYEERGFVPNVCFPCATIHDSETGKIALYYGAADSYVGVAFTTLDEIVDYIKDHSLVREEDTELGIR